MSQSYLVARASGFHFRIRIPLDLQPLFGRRELRRSLSRLSRHHARAEAQRLGCLALDFFSELRVARNNYTTAELQGLVDRWLNDQLCQAVTEYRLARREGRPLPDPDLRNPETLEVLGSVMDDFVDDLRFGQGPVAKAAYERWEPLAVEIAEAMGLDFADMSPDQQERLTFFAARAEARRYHLLSKHSPDFTKDFWSEQAPSRSLISSAASSAAKSRVPTLGEAWERCVAHYRAQGKSSWNIADSDNAANARPTKNRHAEWLRDDLFELWGPDLPISEITWEHLEELRDCFQFKFPVGRNKNRKYRDKTLREIVDGPGVPETDRIRGSTKESKFRLSRDFFQFLRTHPTTKPHFEHDADQVIRYKADPLATYEPWTVAELKTILESGQVHSRFRRRGDNYHPGGMFWLLAVLAYTGGRQQEIMGLRAEDVELDREYPVIHIRKHPFRGSVKTVESERWVPIHKDLLTMGLADWIQFRTSLEDPTLWPVSDRGSNYWGDRFRENITKPLGLHVSRRKVMHSFRGTFDSVASHVIPDTQRRLMTGHVASGTDYRHYIRQPDHLLPEYSAYINKVDFRLDLEKLEGLWRGSMPGVKRS